MLRSVRLSKGLLSLLVVALMTALMASSALAASDDDLEELYQRVNGLESLVKDLSISVMNASKSLEAQATGLQPRIFNVENMVKDLSFDVKKTVAAMSDIHGYVDALIAQVEEFQPLVITLQSTVVKFGDKLDYITNDIDMLKVGLANLSDQADETDARLTVVNDHLSGQIATLSDEFAQLYSAVSALKAAVEENSAGVGALHEATVTLNVKVESNSESIYGNHAAIEELGAALEEVYVSVSAAFEETESKFGMVHDAHTVVDERISKLERAVEELGILGPTLASLRNTVAGLAARADRVDARLSHLEAFAEAMANAGGDDGASSEAVDALNGRMDDAEAMIAALKEAVAALASNEGTDTSFLEAAIFDLQDQIDRLKALVGTSSGSGNGASQAAIDDLKGKIGQLVIELEATKMELATLREQVGGSQTTVDVQQITNEIRTSVLAEIGDITELSAMVDEAKKNANAANGLALLALLAGAAAIALNLLI